MKIAFALAVSVMLSGNAQATEFSAAIGHKGYGRCHMDSCGFFTITSATQIGEGRDGTLYKLDLQVWDATYRQTEDDHEYDRAPIKISKKEYQTQTVYCSKTRPTTFYQYDGKWESVSLRPGDDNAVLGYNESAYMLYYAACHDAIVHEGNPKNHLAQRLGYRFHTTDAGEIEDPQNLKPMDMLKGVAANAPSPAPAPMSNGATPAQLAYCAKIVKRDERLMCFDVLSGHSE